MRYQLALQFAADSLEDFDRLVALEDRLIEELGGCDGRWTRLRNAVVTDQGVPNVMQSAHREMDGEDYVVSSGLIAHRIQRSLNAAVGTPTTGGKPQ